MRRRQSEYKASLQWRLHHASRKDVEQADVAPLAAALLGVDVPRHSVGDMPLCYLQPSHARAASAVTVARQAVAAAQRRVAQVASRSVFVSDDGLPGLRRAKADLSAAVEAQDGGRLYAAETHAAAATSVAHQVVRQMQERLYWPLLLPSAMGYVGYVMLCVAVATAPPAKPPVVLRASSVVVRRTRPSMRIPGAVAAAVVVVAAAAVHAFHWLDGSPVLFHMYCLPCSLCPLAALAVSGGRVFPHAGRLNGRVAVRVVVYVAVTQLMVCCCCCCCCGGGGGGVCAVCVVCVCVSICVYRVLL